MLACSSSFTVFLTTPCRPLIPAMRILEVTEIEAQKSDIVSLVTESTNTLFYLGNLIFVRFLICIPQCSAVTLFNSAKLYLTVQRCHFVYFQQMTRPFLKDFIFDEDENKCPEAVVVKKKK